MKKPNFLPSNINRKASLNAFQITIANVIHHLLRGVCIGDIKKRMHSVSPTFSLLGSNNPICKKEKPTWLLDMSKQFDSPTNYTRPRV